MKTREGFVEVEAEEVDRVAGVARVEEIRPEDDGGGATENESGAVDRPTPARMRRMVMMRGGGVCANPWCDHEAQQGHHVLFRSKGGRTALFNIVGVCRTCHALVHGGLLRVTGRSGEDLRWEPKLNGVMAQAGMNAEAAAGLPFVQAESRDSGNPEDGNGREDSSPDALSVA